MKEDSRSKPAFQHRADVLIVGAGMAGLAAAADLQQANHGVLVMDKGRGVGGRLASRRIGGATFDHGAQFVTARDPRFAAVIDQWLRAGVVEEWYRGSNEQTVNHPRWRGKPTMTALAKHLAERVEVVLRTRVQSLQAHPEGWVAQRDDGVAAFAAAVLLTPPVPQSLALLNTGACEVAPELNARLRSIEYERCLAVMALLDGPTRIPPPGCLAPSGSPVAWIADNRMKGVSVAPAVTIHATSAFSLKHWDDGWQESGRELLRAAEPWLGSEVTEFQVHGWRYSKPTRIEEHPYAILSRYPPLVLAGDAFVGPRVEGAVLSGWAAADALIRLHVKRA